MWIDLNSAFYLNYSIFFKIPYLSERFTDSCKLLYNSSIDKFFLFNETYKELIYLDNSEYYNSYVESYLINDYYNYKSRLKPYYSSLCTQLNAVGLNTGNYTYNLNYETIEQFQTEDENYVVVRYKLPTSSGSLGHTQFSMLVCNKIDFEDNIILLNNRYATFNLYSKSEKFIYISNSMFNCYTNSYRYRIDFDDRDYRYDSKDFFYIKNNSISFDHPSTGSKPENKFPVWRRADKEYKYVFDTSENKIPDDIPETLLIAFNGWEFSLDFLGTSYYSTYNMRSFEDDYSDKENLIRYGFSNRADQLGASIFYKNGGGYILFVIEFSSELNGYKLFDINNPNAGYFLCSDNNCLKEQTSYRFKAFLNENIYREDVFNYYKDNDLIITWQGFVSVFTNNATMNNNSYKYCLNKISKLSTIYNVQIPFIRF